VGGGSGADARLGRELWRDVVSEEVPAAVERLLITYLRHRSAPGETFLEFANRHDVDTLKALIETTVS
jgi:ferredoxin-nitrite reductase